MVALSLLCPKCPACFPLIGGLLVALGFTWNLRWIFLGLGGLVLIWSCYYGFRSPSCSKSQIRR